MARVTAIVNLKGGVAKSTSAINMAAILAKEHGKKILIVDADSQCNTSEFFGADPLEGNLAQVLRGSGLYEDPGKFAASRIQKTNFPGIWNWDSAFHAMTVSRYDEALAKSCVTSFLQFARVAHFHHDVGGHYAEAVE